MASALLTRRCLTPVVGRALRSTRAGVAHSTGRRQKTTHQRRSRVDVVQTPDIDPTHPDELNPDRFVGKTGGDIIHDLLVEYDVDTVFGYPGGAILPLFDAIHESPHFKFILPRHEQGGGHMAQGYARVTGKPGVLVVTSGPGATNVITPMQDALMDGTPLVVFTGQVPRIMQGTDAFQEADIVGMSRACTKWNVTVKSLKDLPRYVSRAFEVATSGRPGPVLVDLPKDITAGVLTEQHTIVPPRLKPKMEMSTEQVNLGGGEALMGDVQAARVAALINKSQRPIIYAGHGVVQSGASDVLRELAIKANIPVTTTLHGMGCFDEHHPLSLRMLGMHGSAYANYAMQEADLVICMGARFDDRVTGRVSDFAPKARKGAGLGIIQFEINKKNINKVIEGIEEPVTGDLMPNLQKLSPMLEFKERSEWLSTISGWKKDYPFRYEPAEPGQPIKPQRVIESLHQAVVHRPQDVVITTGVGAHQMWAAQYYRWTHPRSIVTSGGSGTMGYGLPAAIGCQVGAPDKIVVDIDGDASLSMTLMEFTTACQYDIPVKCLLLNNDFQGMVKQWQDLFYDERYSHTEMYNPDFPTLAKGMGGVGMICTDEAELDAMMKEFIECKRPVLFEVKVDKREHVYPMVPAGKALHEMELGPCRT